MSFLKHKSNLFNRKLLCVSVFQLLCECLYILVKELGSILRKFLKIRTILISFFYNFSTLHKKIGVFVRCKNMSKKRNDKNNRTTNSPFSKYYCIFVIFTTLMCVNICSYDKDNRNNKKKCKEKRKDPWECTKHISKIKNMLHNYNCLISNGVLFPIQYAI